VAVRKILLDTNAYVAFKRGDSEALAIIQRAPTIGISTIVLGELLAGFACGNCTARNRAELAAFLESSRVRVHPATETTADHCSTLFATLKAQGKPIPTNDLWIAATALEHGYAVYTRDRHFAQIDNLRSGQNLDDFLP